MGDRFFKIMKGLRRFVTANQFAVLTTATALSLLLAAFVWSRYMDLDFIGNHMSNATATNPDTTGGETTGATDDTQIPDSTVYPEETVEFQVSEIPVSYLQTDIYTTVDNNVFMDSLLYTGYNMTKHRADGMMWEFVPAEDKRRLGYLSKISYGSGCSGYETDDSGRPDITRFEQGDLVCASFVSYVYFNYLPNVAGIDTSALTRPTNSTSAVSWYTAAQDWVAKGYSEYIPFEYKVMGSLGNSFIQFTPSQEIPVGSLVIFCNPKISRETSSHVAIYAGYVNGYDWLYHVGNSNGPEFCAVQRMNFGSNARWPIAVITPPSNVRLSPVLEIELLDKSGNPIAGSEFILKHPTSGKEISLGATDENGKLVKYNLSYGDFELVQIVPEGYSCQNTSNQITLSGVNNSYNTIRIINTKEKS